MTYRRPEPGAVSRRRLVLLFGIVLLATTFACSGGSNVPNIDEDSLLALTIDSPTSVSTLPLVVAGWGADLSSSSGVGVEQVEIMDGGCNGELVGTARHGIRRPDVAEQYGTQFLNSGWELIIQALSAGEHRLAVRLRSATRPASTCETVSVTVPSKLTLSIESPVNRSVLLPVRIGGWAVDLGADTGTGVDHVNILDGGCNGELLGRAEYGIVRGDVAERYGHQFGESGWELILDTLTKGVHTLGVRLFSGATKTTTCETIEVSVL